MPKPFAITVLAALCLLACTSDDDTTEPDAASTGSAGGGVASAAGVGGGGAADPFEDCVAYCARWMDCTNAYVTVGDCITSCQDDIRSASLGGAGCFEAYRLVVACIPTLSCDELVRWPTPGEPCEPEWTTAQDAC